MKRKLFVLASASPRRKALMRRLGMSFRTARIRYRERFPRAIPEEAALILAWKKLEAARRRMRNGIIITADTVVALNGLIFGKPESKRDAERMLRLLAGETHEVITALALHDSESETSILGSERTLVTMRRLSDPEIARYVESREPYDKAGAYGIQGMGGTLISAIDGDYFNVVGFPLRLLSLFAESAGVSIPRSRVESLYSKRPDFDLSCRG